MRHVASYLGKRKRDESGPEKRRATSVKQPRKRLYSVRLCPDPRYGRGVFAQADIPANTFLFKYAGVRVGPKDYEKHDGDICYFWLLTDGVTVDGSKGGNASRFLNHYKGAHARARMLHVDFVSKMDLSRV